MIKLDYLSPHLYLLIFITDYIVVTATALLRLNISVRSEESMSKMISFHDRWFYVTETDSGFFLTRGCTKPFPDLLKSLQRQQELPYDLFPTSK